MASPWKGIQKKTTSTTETPPTNSGSRSRASSLSDVFEDGLSDVNDEEDEDEDDDYFQDEDPEQETNAQELLKMKAKAIEEDKKRYLDRQPLEIDDDFQLDSDPIVKSKQMSFILPALQTFSDDDDDDESLQDPNEKYRLDLQDRMDQSTADLVAEIEALEMTHFAIDQATAEDFVIEPVEERFLTDIEPGEKPATWEPVPSEKKPEVELRKLEVKVIEEEEAVRIDPVTTEEGLVELSQILENIRPSLGLQENRLRDVLPEVERSVKAVANDQVKRLEIQSVADDLVKPVKREIRSREQPVEDPIDLDMFKDNAIAIQSIDSKGIPVNILKPHEQELSDEPVRQGMKYLFDNQFMKAKAIFETKATTDPLYALGLGAMGFMKAMMTYYEADTEAAMNALATAYTIAKTQIDNSSYKKPFKDTVSQYLTTLLSTTKTGLPADPPASAMPNSSGGISSPNDFIPNGVLRAHVIKAECCLLMGILQMTQENVIGYLKCGLNLRRAYYSYSIVWQEYKRMGQEYAKYMDRDTVSAIQFGIGAVHLILSSMPPKILKIFSVLGWKSDKQLGFALLKLCLDERGIRSPLASLTLLAYYSVLTSFAPQLYSKEMMNPAIECLLDAQSNHPNSCFFLFFAARIARVAKNLSLSTQSFRFAAESSKGEWAEVPMKQMSDYEIGFNLALQLDWVHAADYFEQLSQEKYWSPAFSKYFVGACYEMLGQRTEAILAFAEVPSLAQDIVQETVLPNISTIANTITNTINKATGKPTATTTTTSTSSTKKTYIDSYVKKKVEFFQKTGYQDMDFNLPGLEILLVMNAFEYMEKENLEQCLDRVQHTLELIYEREKTEYNIRLREVVPTTDAPDYTEQRAILLLTKASILNALGRHQETIPHLNWVLDHRESIQDENWILPFTFWESGVTSWGLGNYKKSRKLWQSAMACTKYDFEYRMAVRLSLAIGKCDEMGITETNIKQATESTANGRKRMPIVTS